MKFEEAARFGTYISKSFAKDIFRLLNNYRDISASEAASRLGLHIQTVQDFLEILEGKHDNLPEQAFYMVGTIEEAIQKAKEF